MTVIRIVVLSIMAALMISGCTTNKVSNCFPGKRCNEYQVYTRCGSYLKYECEDICTTCKAYEPSCYSCFACINDHPESCLLEQKINGHCPTA